MAATEELLTSKEVAKRLKLDPKALRKCLRRMGKGAKGKKYEFTEKDIPKLSAAIKEHQLKPEKK